MNGVVKSHDLKLYKENDLYYLDVKFQTENDKCIKEVHAPCVRLPMYYLERGGIPIRTTCDGEAFINLGFGDLKLIRSNSGHVLTETIIEHKTKEMTLSEIEKKLGHKIKIITEEVRKNDYSGS